MKFDAVNFIYTSINEMIVDDLIKFLKRIKFQQFMNQLGLILKRKSESDLKEHENQ